MNKYKMIIIFALAYLMLVIGILFIIGINDVELLIYPNISIKYDGKNYNKIEFDSKKRYDIYIDNKYDTTSTLTIDDISTYLNEEVINDFIAVSNNKVKVIDYKIKEITKDEYQEVLNELKIVNYNDMKISKKILIDYDNDNEIEEINILSNVFVDPFMEDINDDKFSIIYVVDNNERNLIYNKQFNSDMDGCLLRLPYIVDFNNDNKYEMITTCTYFDKLGTKVQIFEMKKNKYELIKEL